MSPDERAALLAEYRGGYDAVVAAVEDVGEVGLDRRPADGWTARQVVHHLADSEMTAAIRLRRLLAEEAPVIAAYDEERFARVLHYDRPIAASLVAVRGARESSFALLERLEEAEWLRTGTHTESGAYSVETWLRIYTAHAHDHAAQIRAAAATES